MTTSNPPQQDLEEALQKKMANIAAQEQADAASKLAESLQLPFSDLTGTPIDPEALTLLPEETSRASQLAIIYRNGSNIIVIVKDPTLPETKAELDKLAAQSYSIKVLVTTQEALEKAWKRYENTKKTEIFEVGSIDISEENLNEFQSKINSIEDLKNQISAVAITQVLEILVAGALKTEASDIHFEPEQANTRLRYRLDGLLQDVTYIDQGYYHKILNRIKILSKLKLNVHNAPQDGRFTIHQKNIDIEVRVSILPSEYGETIVMRLLDPRTIKAKLEDLGMREDILELVTKQIQKPNGALLTTGPTGSGKTTTLYAFINELNKPDTKIITVEDPIEYHINGISQTQVDPSRGYTFADGLRAIVRQDPDIILIGEIRDLETADIALHAALTGHLVLSTIHTNDAAGTIPRLVDLGIKPETIAPAITMAMGQRLLRKLCPKCKIQGNLTSEDLKIAQETLNPIRERFKLPEITDNLPVYFPAGCVECNNTGYKGRVGVYEIFTVSKAMEKLILSNPSMSDVKDLAISEGMVTMLQDGYMKLIQGISSIEEIHRILG